MGRVLGIDYGEKRIGVAISDKSKIFAQPLDFVFNNANVYENISKIVKEKEVELIIIGLPLKLNGEESETSVTVREFSHKLNNFLKVNTEFIDERLTTSYAEKLLISGDVKRKDRKKLIDSLSAQIFLQNYLDKIKNSDTIKIQ